MNPERTQSFGWAVCTRLMLYCCVLLVVGCATLQPVALPDEYSQAPARSLLWTQLDGVRTDDWLYLLNTGREALEWRLRLIDSAAESLDLQTFLWKDDPLGLTIQRHVFAAADRGVRVRILLDDSFTATHDTAIREIDQHPNIEFRIYNPYARRINSLVVRQLLNLGDFSRVDHRMHNKVMVADNRAAIVGGRNLADEYFGSHKTSNFRDLEVLTAGPVVRNLSQQFDEYWNDDWSFPSDRIIQSEPTRGLFDYGTWLEDSASYGLQENPAARRQAWMHAARAAIAGVVLVFGDRPAARNPAATDTQPVQLAEKIVGWLDSATEEVILVSAYLIPTAELERAVERAEDRGVRIRILTNSLRSNNHVAAHSAYRRHIRRLLEHGAEVHEVRTLAKDRGLYMDQPVQNKHLGLHAKLLLIDDSLSYIGSANLDPRSLRINTEMGLLVRGRAFNRLVRKNIAIDFDRRNAWYVEIGTDKRLSWSADDVVLYEQPAESDLQRIEDWFLSILPLEDEM